MDMDVFVFAYRSIQFLFLNFEFIPCLSIFLIDWYWGFSDWGVDGSGSVIIGVVGEESWD